MFCFLNGVYMYCIDRLGAVVHMLVPCKAPVASPSKGKSKKDEPFIVCLRDEEGKEYWLNASRVKLIVTYFVLIRYILYYVHTLNIYIHIYAYAMLLY